MKKKTLAYLFLCVLPLVAYPQWSDNPHENTMINDSIGSQAVPMVVTNNSGESYISWYSATEGNRYDVFLQKLDKNGVKLWDEAGLLISNNETQSWVTTYGLMLDQDENVLLVTQDIRTGYSNVFAYKISPDGTLLWGNDGVQLSNTIDADYSPKMAVANNNDVVFLWGDDPADTLINSKIFLTRVSSDGSILWETHIADTAWDYLLPQILHTENDDFIVSWMTKTNIPDTTLGEEHYMHALAQKFDANGNTVWVGNVPIDSGNIMLWLSLFTTPYLENDGSGGAYVLWQSFTPMGTGGVPTSYLNRIYSDGHIWKPNGYNVSQLSGNHHSAAEMIYMESLDQVMVCWQEYHYGGTDCWGVYGQMFNADGQYLWDSNGHVIIPLMCSVDTAYFNVLLGESTNNNAVVAYHKEYLNIVETDTAIITLLYSTAIDADGETIWDPAVVPLSLTSSYKLHTFMGNLVDNQWVIAWEDNIENPHDYFNTGIYAQNISVDGVIGPLGIHARPVDNVSKLAVFPNPSTNHINIIYNLKTKGVVQIDLLDINGKYISRLFKGQQMPGTHSAQFNVADLKTGVYLLRLQSGNSVAYLKVIKK